VRTGSGWLHQASTSLLRDASFVPTRSPCRITDVLGGGDGARGVFVSTMRILSLMTARVSGRTRIRTRGDERRDGGLTAHPPLHGALQELETHACARSGKRAAAVIPCHKRVRPRDSLCHRAALTCQPATPASARRRCMCVTSEDLSCYTSGWDGALLPRLDYPRFDERSRCSAA
jgi:hypothetical protein